MSEHEWKISKPAPHCQICSTAFVTDGTYYSALLQSPEGLQRADYCDSCFQGKRPADVFYFWKATPKAANGAKKQRPAIDMDNVLEFFKRLEGDASPQRIAFRYILALMLSRKKMLAAGEKKKDDQGQVVQNYREKNAGAETLIHAVVEPELSEEEIQGLSSELGVLLGIATTAEPAVTELLPPGLSADDPA